MSDETFRSIDGKLIYMKDAQGFVHSCEGANFHPGVRLLWTLCDRDVPANAAWHPKPDDKVTCATCLLRGAK